MSLELIQPKTWNNIPDPLKEAICRILETIQNQKAEITATKESLSEHINTSDTKFKKLNKKFEKLEEDYLENTERLENLSTGNTRRVKEDIFRSIQHKFNEQEQMRTEIQQLQEKINSFKHLVNKNASSASQTIEQNRKQLAEKVKTKVSNAASMLEKSIKSTEAQLKDSVNDFLNQNSKLSSDLNQLTKKFEESQKKDSGLEELHEKLQKLEFRLKKEVEELKNKPQTHTVETKVEYPELKELLKLQSNVDEHTIKKLSNQISDLEIKFNEKLFEIEGSSEIKFCEVEDKFSQVYKDFMSNLEGILDEQMEIKLKEIREKLSVSTK